MYGLLIKYKGNSNQILNLTLLSRMLLQIMNPATSLDVPASDTSRIYSRDLHQQVVVCCTLCCSAPHGLLDWNRHSANIENVHFCLVFLLSSTSECVQSLFLLSILNLSLF